MKAERRWGGACYEEKRDHIPPLNQTKDLPRDRIAENGRAGQERRLLGQIVTSLQIIQKRCL